MGLTAASEGWPPENFSEADCFRIVRRRVLSADATVTTPHSGSRAKHGGNLLLKKMKLWAWELPLVCQTYKCIRACKAAPPFLGSIPRSNETTSEYVKYIPALYNKELLPCSAWIQILKQIDMKGRQEGSCKALNLGLLIAVLFHLASSARANAMLADPPAAVSRMSQLDEGGPYHSTMQAETHQR